jgi:hypothetical protein
MFASTISILNGAATPVAKSFVQVVLNPTGSIRQDSSSTVIAPTRMIINHAVQGKGADTIDRHLLQFTTARVNSLGVSRTLTTNFVLAVPRDSIITASDVADHVAFVRNYLATSGVVAGLLIGES